MEIKAMSNNRTYNADGTLGAVSLQKTMQRSLFPKHTSQKVDRDILETIAEEDHLVAFEIGSDGYLVHLGPPKPRVHHADSILDEYSSLQKEDDSLEKTDDTLPRNKDRTSSFSFHRLFKNFSGQEDVSSPSDAGNPCQCPHAHSARCPFSMEVRGRLGVKQSITGGHISLMCAQC